MRNLHLGRNIFGDLRTQKMAQKGLPVLVSKAQKGETILLRELAQEIAPDLTQINWTMGWVFGWIHTTLYELERSEDWEYGEIPGLTAIALADHETPTNWMDKQTRVDPNTPLSWKDYKSEHLLPVFNYDDWDEVMNFVIEKLAAFNVNLDAAFNVNLDDVDFNNFIIDEGQSSLLGSEPVEEAQEVPEGEHRYFVYAWRWCGDERFAKIGRTRNGLKGVENRMVTTYHPTDDPVLLGVRKCADAEESHKTEQYILNGLDRTRSDREWVKIDEKFNEMLDKSFFECPTESDLPEARQALGCKVATLPSCH